MSGLISEHIPGCACLGRDPLTMDFETTEGLLAIDFVNRFAEMDDFHQFSLVDDVLIAEFEKGYKWWVVGYLRVDFPLNLPEWDGVKKPYEDRL